MARRLLAAVIAAALIAAPAPAWSAMPVQDNANLIESIKSKIEAIKQTKELIEIAQFAKETVKTIKDVKDTIGPAISLAMSASSWMRDSERAMECLVPDLSSLVDLQFDVTDVCGAMDWARAELGVPTNAQLESELGQGRRDVFVGRYSWTEYLKREAGTSSGEAPRPLSELTPDEVQALREVQTKVWAKRKAMRHDAAMDGVGLALSAGATGKAGVGEAIDSIAEMAGVTTLQERVGHTNKILAKVLTEMQLQRQILAKLLLLQATDALQEEPVLHGMEQTLWNMNPGGTK